MNIVFLSLGSNLGEKEENINKSLAEISSEIGEIVKKSSNFYSKAQGFESENDFINIVIELRTKLNPRQLLEKIITIEKKIGRKKKSLNKIYHDRIIDIDILFFNDIHISENDLIIPHPSIYERNFILVPLREIAPQF